MHHDSDSRLGDGDDVDRLNQYLDARARGVHAHSCTVDPGQALAIEHLFRLHAQQTTDLNLKRLIWADLMQERVAPITPLRPVASLSTEVHALPLPDPAFHRPSTATAKSVWRFRSIAASVAILLIAASTLLVADPANRRNEARERTAVIAAPSSNPTEARFAVAPCSVDPRNISDLQLQLQDVVDGNSITVPTPFVSMPIETNGSVVLPEGPIPDDASIAAVGATYAEYWGCVRADDPLRVAAMFTDEGLQRSYYPNGIPDIARIMRADRSPDPDEDRFTFDVGDPAPGTLTDFRSIGDSRIGAYVSSSPNGLQDGYVVFLKDGDRWLIDDIAAFRG